MPYNKRKRTLLAGHIAKPSDLNKRSAGFSSRDQRLPASPPIDASAPSLSGAGFMATVRARYRDAVDKLFGTPPRVLNSTSSFSDYQLPGKRIRPQSPVAPADQVVPEAANIVAPSNVNPDCQRVNELWTAGGVGPELMLRTAEELSERIVQLYRKAVDPVTSNVDYSSLVHSPDFHDYLVAARKLRYFDPLLLNEKERKAFFLNVYNSLMIHAIAVVSKPISKFDRVSMYNSASYDIGGRPYSLNMIEHGVLRGNRPGCGPFAQAPFTEHDARKQCIQTIVDPRIHFALNCGAKSCPAVRFYEAETLDHTLDAATRIYLQSMDVDTLKRVVTLPKLLQWYKTDFSESGNVDDLLIWTLPYVDVETRKVLQGFLHEKQNGTNSFKVVYAGYDWTVNDSSL